MLPATKTGTVFTYPRRAANAIKSVWLLGILVRSGTAFSRLHRMTKVTDNNLVLLIIIITIILIQLKLLYVMCSVCPVHCVLLYAIFLFSSFCYVPLDC